MQRFIGAYRIVGKRGGIRVPEAEKDDDSYGEQEAQRRFEKLVDRALNTRPKTPKSMTPKGVPAQSKKRRKRSTKAA
jgi:hypothetical protein